MNKCLLKVSGKNIKNFLIKLDKNKINVIDIKNIGENSISILIYLDSLEKIEKIKGIYEIEVIKCYGVNEIKKILKTNIHLIIILVINIFLVFFITKYIYEVEIIEENNELKEKVNNVLEKKGIKKYALKPNNLDEIKNSILKENKNYLEWIEIIPSGIKYIVKLEERIENKKKSLKEPSDIVAKKDGVIKKIIASSGKILVEKEMFVKKGDTLVTGVLNDETLITSKAYVYAEVWYKISSEVSLHEKTNEETGKSKKGFKIKFFEKEKTFYKKYKYNKIKENIIFKNDVIPFYLSFDEVKEINLIDRILTLEEAKEEAINKAKNKIMERLEKTDSIISENELKVQLNNSKIIVDVLVITLENIAEERKIEIPNVQGNI